jgi:phage tail protein X
MTDIAASISGRFALFGRVVARAVAGTITADLAADADPRIVHAHRHETLDGLIWRTRGLGSGTVELVLAANPGLADMAAHLPEGHPVFIPDLGPEQSGARALNLDLIQLWD